MKGSMDDVAGKVWTYLAKQDEPVSFLTICCNVYGGIREIGDALSFWIDNEEVESIKHPDDVVFFRIINRHIDDASVMLDPLPLSSSRTKKGKR